MESANFFTHIAVAGFMFLTPVFFGKYPLRTAIIIMLVGGWLFLPQVHYYIHFIPFRTRLHAISLALLLGILTHNPKGFMAFRFSWLDLPIICYCISPMISSVTNGLGVYDGAQSVEFNIVDYGIPYAIGRSYFGTFVSLKELAIGALIGTLILVPFVLIEIRLSPQMHRWVYGWYPHEFIQTVRAGSYRPSVFMSHGLELAIWNSASAFIGWQLYLHRSIRQTVPFLNIPLLPSLVTLFIVLIISHSSGAFLLFCIALALTEISIRIKSFMPLIALALFPVIFISLRASGTWDGHQLVDISRRVSGEGRASSLEFRFKNDDALAEKDRQHLVFGWGRWSRGFITDKYGNLLNTPDSQWIIIFGEGGVFALAAINGIYLFPAILLFMKLSRNRLGGSLETPAIAFAVFFLATMIDNLFNAMSNPLLIVASGGICSLALSPSAMSGTLRGSPRRPEPQALMTTRVI